MPGTGDRTIHGISWHDNLAWMENMKGSRWNSHILAEQKRWKRALTPLQYTIKILEDELEAASQTFHTMLFRSGGGAIEIGMAGSMTVSWKLKGKEKVRTATTLETNHDGSVVWTIEEVGDGAELYAVRMYSSTETKFVWERVGVAPYVAIVGGRCYCLEAKKSLVYWRLVSWNCMTGDDYRIHYEEEDYRYNLELVGCRGHAFLRRQAGTKEDAFLITANAEPRVLEGVCLEARRFIFGSGSSVGYLVWTADSGWKAFGDAARLRLPSFTKAVPETLDMGRGLLVTKWEGCRTLWKVLKALKAAKAVKAVSVLWKGYGQILIDPWESSWIRFTCLGKPAAWWNLEDSLHLGLQSDAAMVKAKSLDGTEVPFLLLAGAGKPRGLLVIGYGAYGLSTPFMTSRWEPLLARGWCLAIGLWRGGGDHTPEWEDAGRLYGRKKVLEDAEAVVRAAQSIVKVGSSRTVLYGRSAGGLWVGGLAAKFPRGELASGAYMEVPYLDVLRTITNRDLPLTEIETDEFGLPEQRLSDFAGALEWSPMELLVLGGKGIPGMWQIVRTGLNDSEVLAYESVKWIARSKNTAAFLAVEGGQGHFISGRRGFEQQAEDLAFILARHDE
jgi:hypothetical protein